MTILIIRKTGPHAINHLNEGDVIETSIEHLGEPLVQTNMRGRSYSLVVFDRCSWADISGDVYVFLTQIVPSAVPAIRLNPPVVRSVL